MMIETKRLKMTFTRNSGDAMEFGTLEVLDKKHGVTHTESGVLQRHPQLLLDHASVMVAEGADKLRAEGKIK